MSLALGGVMEAASRGARSSEAWQDGDIIGILPGADPEEANPYVDIPIATGLQVARNLVVANSCAFIAIGGWRGLYRRSPWPGRCIGPSWRSGTMVGQVG